LRLDADGAGGGTVSEAAVAVVEGRNGAAGEAVAHGAAHLAGLAAARAATAMALGEKGSGEDEKGSEEHDGARGC
jgi:hypothetical protein